MTMSVLIEKMNDIVGGRYKIISRLATGGMAEIFLAEENNEKYVIKAPKENDTDSDFEYENSIIKRESDILDILNHQNIVKKKSYLFTKKKIVLYLNFVKVKR